MAILKPVPHHVLITKDTDTKTDEWYGENYQCPHCSSLDIWDWFSFCPICGVRLYWSKEFKEDTE